MADEQAWQDLDLLAGQAFTPTTPVDERSVFAGRQKQIRRIVDAIFQKGQHIIIFGERGVGKTSLANVLAKFLPNPAERDDIVAPRINCDSTDDFGSVWQKVFDQIELTHSKPMAGFVGQEFTSTYNASDLLEGQGTPDSVRRLLTMMSRTAFPIMIIDEFDRLPSNHRVAFADLIKSLSDHATNATVVLVGVADSVEQLIAEHQSVGRALVQIQMPRMAFEEIASVLKTGFDRLNMTINEPATERIAKLAGGLPHYAHLLGLHAARVAIENRKTAVVESTVTEAIARAIEDAHHSIRVAYAQATTSARKDSLFADVLLSCALAKKDDLGTFAAQDVREPLRSITKRYDYDIPIFAQHLNDFSNPKRGEVLTKTGRLRLYRYRFSDPLMQPYVMMKGYMDEKITEKLTPASDASELSLPLWQSDDAPQG